MQQFPIVQRLLRQEGTQFQDVTDIWKPTELLYVAQVRKLLHDMQGKYDEVSGATEEFLALPRSDRYIKTVTEMRFALREAHFQWKANQVRFLNAASKFYQNFGNILRFLHWEAQSGTFHEGPVRRDSQPDKHLKGV